MTSSLSANRLKLENVENSVYNAQDGSHLDPIASLHTWNLSASVSDVIWIYPGQPPLTFGREGCVQIPDRLKHVSKKHFRIYSITYEQGKDEVLPLVYCEDLESTNGTFINDCLIGTSGRERVGFLLSHGDTIEIRPSWKFVFHQPDPNPSPLKYEHRNELEGQDTFTVTDRHLGSGHYGSVYLAIEKVTENASSKQLVCKIVDVKKAMRNLAQGISSSKKSRFWEGDRNQPVKREIEILAGLDHPNIIFLRKAFCTDTTIYMFADLAPGGDLFSYMDTNGPKLVDHHSRVIAIQVAHAIEYLHANHVIHRDIKPENVLVTQTDFGGRVILTDFGFAKRCDNLTGRFTSRLGTGGFVAPEIDFPEQLAPHGYTKAADLWSFGALVAYILTGIQGITVNQVSQLSQGNIVDEFFKIEPQWLDIRPRAADFLRNLLVYRPDSRMSAAAAIKHQWFTRPRTEARELREGYERITKFWKKRHSETVVIEEISRSQSVHPPKGDKSAHITAKSATNLPHDASAYTPATLDRRLQRLREISTCRDILAELKQQDTYFLRSDRDFKTQCKSIPPTGFETLQDRHVFQAKPTIRICDDAVSHLDEVGSIPTPQCLEWNSDSENFPRTNLREISKFGMITGRISQELSVESNSRKRKRTESEHTPDYEAAVRKLPLWTNAEDLKEKKAKIVSQKL